MPTLTKLFSMEEAAQHNTKDDCWVVVDGKVYDVSMYLDEHPGGDDVLLVTSGTDAREAFEDAGHSQEARELMEKFFVGEVDPTAPTILQPKPSNSKNQNQKQKQAKIDEDFAYLYWGTPIAIGISVVVGFLFLRNKLRSS